jgi:4-aminobutyrate aminotransferase-like enzyme
VSETKKHNADELKARDDRYIIRPWSDAPVPIVDAKGCTVTTADGTELLDFTTGYFVNNAGHCHPRVIAAATEQMSQVCQVSGKQTTPVLIDLAERLEQLTPKSIDKSFFVTGGSEASENALKMARQHTKKTDVAGLEHGYHGLTVGALGLCYSEKYRQTAGFELPDNTYFLPHAYCYRCPHQNNCETQCLDEAEKRLDERAETTGAIMAEPVQAVGGIIPPEKWWDRLDKIRRKRGLLLILDEIQTGLGRTGKMFAAEHYGLEPEILTGGKGLSGGVGSLAVTCASDEVSKAYYGGTTPTSGGNAVSAAAGLALIETILDEGLLENCTKMGEYMTGAVWDLNDPWVGDVRFKGLLGGVELVSDRESKEILPKELVVAVKDELFRDGMLITISGPHGNVLRLQPPLSISSAQIDTFVESLSRALRETRSQKTG